jgi:hypothetical protein
VDYVVEAGESGDWTYRKWKNGAFEAYATLRVTPSESTQKDTLYETNLMLVDLPFATTWADAMANASGPYWTNCSGGGLNSTTGNGVVLLRLIGVKEFDTTQGIWVSFVVMGTYK